MFLVEHICTTAKSTKLEAEVNKEQETIEEEEDQEKTPKAQKLGSPAILYKWQLEYEYRNMSKENTKAIALLQ